MEKTITKNTLLDEAAALIGKPSFTHEDNARVARMLDLAEKIDQTGVRSTRLKVFEKALRFGAGTLDQAEMRDLSVSSAINGGFLVPAEFYQQLTEAMRAFDSLFDPDVTTRIETATGAPIVFPLIDDTSASATLIAEGQQDPSGPDPSTMSVNLSALNSTYRSGLVKVSVELLQDSAIDLLQVFSAAFGIRLARGIGKDLVTTLLASATVGITAGGSSTNTGGSETGGTSIGTKDLVNLRKSVNPAYRTGSKVFFFMNDSTLATLDGLLDKNGHPIFPQVYDPSGNRILCGYPVAIMPSMPNIGVNNTPVGFGNLGYFAVRTVEGTRISRLTERFGDFGDVAFRAFMRCKGALLTAPTSDSPIKLLQNASS